MLLDFPIDILIYLCKYFDDIRDIYRLQRVSKSLYCALQENHKIIKDNKVLIKKLNKRHITQININPNYNIIKTLYYKCKVNIFKSKNIIISHDNTVYKNKIYKNINLLGFPMYPHDVKTIIPHMDKHTLPVYALYFKSIISDKASIHNCISAMIYILQYCDELFINNYNSFYISRESKINNNIVYISNFEFDFIFNIKIYNGTYAKLLIGNQLITFELVNNILTLDHIETNIYNNVRVIHTNGDFITFNGGIFKHKHMINNCLINYYLMHTFKFTKFTEFTKFTDILKLTYYPYDNNTVICNNYIL